jgi:hypothetical protein
VWFRYEKKLDSQGAIMVTVTPINLDAQAERLDFQVDLDTHSGNLAFDLSRLATLNTDTAITVSALTWDAPSGGRHLSGRLSFPVLADGKPILSDASTLTLTIKDIGVPESFFLAACKVRVELVAEEVNLEV